MKIGVAYFDTRDLRHVKSDLQDMVDHSCTFVVHCYPEYDLNFNSLVMRDIVAMTREMGMETYINPWGLGRVFGGPEPYSHYVAEHPEECQKNADGSHAPLACLNSKPFREFMRFWIDSAAETSADVVFWDEPHFHFTTDIFFRDPRPDEWSCRCERCKALFYKEYGRHMPAVLDDDVIRFRDDNVVSFLSELCDYAHEKGMKNAVCVLPDENPIFGTSSWEKIAAIESLDIFGTDPYWMLQDKPLDDYVRSTCRRVMDICAQRKIEAQVWVQAFLIWQGREEEVRQAVEVMVEEGVENIAAWAYNGSAYWNHKCQDHEAVWRILGEAFAAARKK